MNVLNEYLNFPFTNKIDISSVPVEAVMGVLRDTFGDNPYQTTAVAPETEALEFYMSNHVVALIRTKAENGTYLTEQQAELVAKYSAQTSAIAVRSFAYLVLICTREMRHLGSSSMENCKITKAEEPVYMFIKENIKPSNENAAAMMVWNGNIPFMMGEYTTVLEKMFRKGSWGGGYGGPAWADVTRCLRDYVAGILTAEMMVDTVWTLCHNNGPIFNKGMLYQNYCPELLRILDVQRAGQVPQYACPGFYSDWYRDFIDEARVMYPELDDEVDYHSVKLTALHPEQWEHIKIVKKGYKVVKPSGGHSEVGIATQTVEMEREQTD